jgi:hypothetical protein
MSSVAIPNSMKSSLSALMQDPAGIGFVVGNEDNTVPSTEPSKVIPFICNRGTNEMNCYLRIISLRLNLQAEHSVCESAPEDMSVL